MKMCPESNPILVGFSVLAIDLRNSIVLTNILYLPKKTNILYLIMVKITTESTLVHVSPKSYSKREADELSSRKKKQFNFWYILI